MGGAILAGTACGRASAPARDKAEAGRASPELALPLVPQPKHVTARTGVFRVDASTPVVVSGAKSAFPIGARLARALGARPPTESVASSGAPSAGSIRLVLAADGDRDPAVAPPRTTDEEAYSLTVTPDGVTVRAKSAAGLYFGTEVLTHLAGARRVAFAEGEVTPLSPTFEIPAVEIDDEPAFPYRAMHLDVARQYFPLDVVKRYIDFLAFYRFNVFHWHLTDDQAFRLVIPGHPEITDVGGKGGAYTPDDVREIVAFARDRFITVVPEIDVPGHTSALLAAHPEVSCTGKPREVPTTTGIIDGVLCAGNDATYALLTDLFASVAKTFPSHLVHIGGDEVPTTAWTECAKCQHALASARASSPELARAPGVEALRGIFLRNVAAIVTKLGRRPMVWDEPESAALLPKETIPMAWRSHERGPALVDAGYDVVLALPDTLYFNFWQSRTGVEPGHPGYVPWTKVLAFDAAPPAATTASRRRFLGGSGSLWTEHVRTRAELETLLLPRLGALAEALWSHGRSKAEDFATRFTLMRPELDASNARYFVDPPTDLSEKLVFLSGIVHVGMTRPTLFPDARIRFTLDGTAPTSSSPIFEPFDASSSFDLQAATFLPNGRSSPVVKSRVEQQVARPPKTLPSPPSKGVWCRAHDGQFQKLPDYAKLGKKPPVRYESLAAALEKRALHFALACDAFVHARTTAVYRFLARADDGIRLEVDGERILEDDGEHEARDVRSEIALAAGLHAVRVLYFQGEGERELSVRVTDPTGVTTPMELLAPLDKPAD